MLHTKLKSEVTQSICEYELMSINVHHWQQLQSFMTCTNYWKMHCILPCLLISTFTQGKMWQCTAWIQSDSFLEMKIMYWHASSEMNWQEIQKFSFLFIPALLRSAPLPALNWRLSRFGLSHPQRSLLKMLSSAGQAEHSMKWLLTAQADPARTGCLVEDRAHLFSVAPEG